MNRLVILLLLLMAGTLKAEETYNNAVFPHDWADPDVWRGDDGRYYSFSTAGAKYAKGLGKFLWSDDLVKWDTIADRLWTTETVTKLKEYGTNIWAPQVTKIEGQWLMYLTCYNSDKDCSIVVMKLNAETFPKADGKCGTWTLVGPITRSKETGIADTIDPFVTSDPETGRVWMFFGSTGKVYRVELTTDGMSVKPNAEYVHVAGKEIAADKTRQQVFEGSYLYQHKGYWYFFVSSGLYTNETYNVKVGRSEHLTGTFVDEEGRPMTEGQATTILSTPDAKGDFWGPGHIGGIVKDSQQRTYLLYHCHGKDIPVTSSTGYIPRALMMQQIYWNEETGWPYLTDGMPQASDIVPNLSTTPTENEPEVEPEEVVHAIVTDEKNSECDVNNDGRVTVSDLTIVIERSVQK